MLTRLSVALVLVAAAITLAASAAGCRATIVPPVDPDRPSAVYLIDYGRTSAVALPADPHTSPAFEHDAGPDSPQPPFRARLVRYAYGDWNWYALRKTGGWSAVRAIAWSTRGALGRGEFHAPPPGNLEAMRQELAAQRVFELIVPGDRVQRLRSQLDALHAEAATSGPSASAHGLEFVSHERPYWLFSNSNHQSAAWLEQLGCSVRGPTILSRWRIKLPAGPPPPDNPAGSPALGEDSPALRSDR